VSFIDQHKEEYGVEPVCSVLPIAPQPTTSIRGAGDSLRAAQLGTSATTSCNQRFSACTRTTNSSTAPRRFGGSCDVRTSVSLAVR
jgi:hypothetical protein